MCIVGEEVCGFCRGNFRDCSTPNTQNISLSVLEFHTECNHNNTLPTMAIYPDCKKKKLCWIHSRYLRHEKLCVQRGDRKYWAVIKLHSTEFGKKTVALWTFRLQMITCVTIRPLNQSVSLASHRPCLRTERANGPDGNGPMADRRKYFHPLPLQLQWREYLASVGCS